MAMAAASAETLSLSLKDADALLVKQNLQLLAKRYDVSMAEADIVQARLLDNPTISLEENVYNRLNNHWFDFGKQSEQTVEIEQAIDIAGRRAKRIKGERLKRESKELELEDAVRNMRGALHERLIEVYYLSERKSVYDAEVESLSRLCLAMKKQVENGNASKVELMRIENMLVNLRSEAADIADQATNTQGEIRVLLALPSDVCVQPTIDESILLQANIVVDNDIAERADIRQKAKDVETAQAEVKLQKSLALPDVSIKGSYDRAGNFINNYFAVGIGLTIPIFNRNQGEIKKAKLDVEQNKLDLANTKLQAETELNTAIEQARNRLQLLRDTPTDVLKFDDILQKINDNFVRRNISMLEFIDYYDNYKETMLARNEMRKNALLSLENINTITGYEVFRF